MHFVFVSCIKNKALFRDDPSFVYRCENLAYHLQEYGISYELVHISQFNLLKKADVVVFHRPEFSKKLYAIKKFLDFRNILSFIDIDDLIFDPKYVEYNPAYINKIWDEKKTSKQIKNVLKAFKLFENFIVSTLPLEEKLNNILYTKSIHVIPNTVFYYWNEQKIENNSECKKIAYLPGTKSHDKDFALIKEPLERFLNRHPDVHLSITGPLEFELDVDQKQIEYFPRVPFNEHYKNFQDVWLNIAPLEETPFNMCKSAIKVIEAGFWAIPTLCSFNPDNERFQSAGALIAKDKDEWYDILEKMYNKAFYQQVQQQLSDSYADTVSIDKPIRKLLSSIQDRNTQRDPDII